MFYLELTKSGEPAAQMEKCELGVDPIVIGRDASADWTVAENDKGVSRRHVEVTPMGGRIRVRSLGRTGVTLSPAGTPLPSGAAAMIGPGEGFSFGDFFVTFKRRAGRGESPNTADLSDTPSALLDAFLEGAGLEISAFVVDDPAVIMRRAGQMYMEAVCGLCDLMAERNKLKEALAVDQTTISAGDNNPLRWGAPHRVAIDLLRSDEPGFLGGPDAFNASLRDVRLHVAAMNAGHQAAMAALLQRLDPEKLSNASEAGLFSPGSKKWKAFEKAYTDLSAEINDNEVPMKRAFAEGYERTAKGDKD